LWFVKLLKGNKNMEVIRKIVNVDKLSPIVNLPWKKDMQVEITIMPIEKEITQPNKCSIKTQETTKLSAKFRGVFSKEAGKSFMEHTKNMREEWNNI
jgi:hypothetical protein